MEAKTAELEKTVQGVDTLEQNSDQQSTKSQDEHVQNNDPASQEEMSGTKLILVHIALCLCVFLIGLDLTIIATAIPRITTRFNSIQDVGWYGSAFFIALCASQPLAGKIYMQFPKKIVFLTYVAIFEIGSLVCATAPSSNALIAGRAVAGLGASGIFGGSMIIIATIVPLSQRAIYIGTLNSTYSVASVVGPVIGGAITQHVSWRWCFYINLPIGSATALVIIALLRLKKASTENQPLLQKIKGLDSAGFLLFAGSMVMLLLAVEWGGNTYAWSSSQIIGLFVGCGIGFFGFVAWQVYMRDSAMIPPQTFATRNAKLIIPSSLFVNGPFQIVVYWMPIWFQAILNVSPSGSGVRYLPTVVSDFVTSLVASTIVMKTGIWNPFLLLGEALISIGAGLLTTLYPGISDGHWIGYQIILGVGFSLVITQEFLGLQASVPPELNPIAIASMMTFMYTSCAIALSIAQAVFQHQLISELSPVVGVDTARKILSLGATSFRSVVNPTELAATLHGYSKAITQVFYIPAAAPVIAFFLVLGCKWISTKQHQPRKESKDSTDSTQPLNV